jgi:hypothetical protein
MRTCRFNFSLRNFCKSHKDKSVPRLGEFDEFVNAKVTLEIVVEPGSKRQPLRQRIQNFGRVPVVARLAELNKNRSTASDVRLVARQVDEEVDFVAKGVAR